VLILLTNDDGIYAPGLAALERQLRRLGEVCVVAPATEQSGVGHSITYLTPLVVKEMYVRNQRWGWAVEGSPADCVRLGASELLPRRPDLVVSGINFGLNAGINVLYSGTVAAAIEGAFFGITSVAVSLGFSEQPPFDRAAQIACDVIAQVLAKKGPGPQLYNMNVSTAAARAESPEVRVVPMDVVQYGEKFERRMDPWGRDYYWATGLPAPPPAAHETDLTALAKGFVTLTPLDYNLTRQAMLAEMEGWQFAVPAAEAEAGSDEACVDPDRPVPRARLRPRPTAPGGSPPRISPPDATRHQ
jgi:5'-nucleotidase